MKELDYRICKIIKIYQEEYDIEPKISDISKVIKYDLQGTRYHLRKLEKLGIIKTDGKKKFKRYSLNVDNLE